ncbi:MAG TPA: glycosyltransferase family 2 protein [Kofleriaceae bacterium]|nr:glycosyltransferase family 2 protein [Kofleriaceae bacterium]
MRIAVCIITYRRPEGLRRALEALAAQVFEGPPPELRIVVVDNDEEGSAAAVCDAVRMPWPLDCAVEPRRGIPFARNRCVQTARPHADWIGFIDDDEEPAPNWLAELLRVRAEHDADVVTGPVVPLFSGEIPKWATRSKFFNRNRFPTGTLRDRAFTNNVLFRAEIFDKVQPNFDERMAMTGGSDTHFSRRVHRAGYKIVWADAAEVFETFPASRVVPRWVYQRAYRIGTTTAFIQRDLRSLPVAAAILLPDSSYRLLAGSFLAATGWVIGRHWTVSGVRHICYGAGMLVGLFGGRYEEYRRTHGG